MMTKRFDISSSSSVPQPQNDLLNNKLSEILKEQHSLQLRKEELERMVRSFFFHSILYK
jgi:hypothetical protein